MCKDTKISPVLQENCLFFYQKHHNVTKNITKLSPLPIGICVSLVML